MPFSKEVSHYLVRDATISRTQVPASEQTPSVRGINGTVPRTEITSGWQEQGAHNLAEPLI